MSVDKGALETYLASPNRQSPEVLEEMLASALQGPVLHVLLEAVHGYLLVVDRNRQIVAANEEILSELGLNSVHDAVGCRPGELMHCEHAHEEPGGCGTSRHCHKCGALLSLLACQQSDQVVNGECIIRTNSDGVTEEHSFAVRCTPLVLAGEKVTAIILVDITEEARREVMDDLFFHDVNNVLMGLSGYSELLSHGETNDIAQIIISLSNQLSEQVQVHATLKKAEQGREIVHPTLLVANDILHRLEEVFRLHAVSYGKRLQIELLSEQGRVISERALLMRVLVNLVKNAFEASPAGGTVKVTFQRREGNPVFGVWNEGVISPEVQARIFSKGFSTKSARGRGFGSYSIRLFGEQCLGGSVTFTSNRDAGTLFEITLPAAGPPKNIPALSLPVKH